MPESLKMQAFTSIGTTQVTVVGPVSALASLGVAVVGLIISNVIATAGVTVDVRVRDSSGAITGFVVNAAGIPYGQSLEILGTNQRLILELNDYITVACSTANGAGAVASYIENA